MDDVINRHNSIAEENVKSNGRPATNEYGEWSSQMNDRIRDAFEETKDLSDEEREKRLKEMDEVVKEDLE